MEKKKSVEKGRPSIYIDKALWQQFGILADVVEDRSANDTIVRFIEAYVERHKDKLPKQG